MSDVPLREFLLSALRDANVFGLDDESSNRSFISAKSDIAFEDLDMDSLARMEFCIALEKETGISITPQELQQFNSLGQLLERLQVHQKKAR
jgi:acyl carrier protein